MRPILTHDPSVSVAAHAIEVLFAVQVILATTGAIVSQTRHKSLLIGFSDSLAESRGARGAKPILGQDVRAMLCDLVADAGIFEAVHRELHCVGHTMILAEIWPEA
jgi:hypothetical protein